MAPAVGEVLPTVATDDGIALGDSMDAQPLTNGDMSKSGVGEMVARPSPNTGEPSKDKGKLQTVNERFQFNPEEPKTKKRKKKNNNFLKRGPTALLKNRGTGFEGKVLDLWLPTSTETNSLRRLLL